MHRGIGILCSFTAATLLAGAPAALAQTAANKDQIKRGQYLTTLGGCNDCHSPKMMTPKGPQPDPAKILSGQPAGAQIPPVPAGMFGQGQWAALTNDNFTAYRTVA
jgi:mono/diheme cytochrome c family protein